MEYGRGYGRFKKIINRYMEINPEGYGNVSKYNAWVIMNINQQEEVYRRTTFRYRVFEMAIQNSEIGVVEETVETVDKVFKRLRENHDYLVGCKKQIKKVPLDKEVYYAFKTVVGNYRERNQRFGNILDEYMMTNINVSKYREYLKEEGITSYEDIKRFVDPNVYSEDNFDTEEGKKREEDGCLREYYEHINRILEYRAELVAEIVRDRVREDKIRHEVAGRVLEEGCQIVKNGLDGDGVDFRTKLVCRGKHLGCEEETKGFVVVVALKEGQNMSKPMFCINKVGKYVSDTSKAMVFFSNESIPEEIIEKAKRGLCLFSTVEVKI